MRGGALFNGHSPHYQSTLASCLNLAINSSTESTRAPAARLGGLAMESTVVRGRTATLSWSQVRISIGLQRAFIKPGSDTYRGSLTRRSVVIIAGSPIATTSRPLSVSRVQRARVSLSRNSIFETNVACGQRNKAASICPTWFESSSMACSPMMTMCGISFSTTARRIRATAYGSSARANRRRE